jgi:hypothetical protein
MSDYIGVPPLEKIIPVTKGCDRAFSLRRVDGDGEPVDFDEESTVYMWVDLATPVKLDADVDGSLAALVISDVVCDQVSKGTRWRVVLDQGELEVPLMVGRFERHDG